MTGGRLVKTNQHLWFRGKFHVHPPLSLLLRLGGTNAGRRRARWNPSERAFDECDGVLCIHVADDGDHRIRGAVIRLKEGLGPRAGQGAHIRGPADHRQAIRMRLKRGRCEGFIQAAAR